MDYGLDLAQNFQPDLLREEKVVWAGQPDPRFRFSGGDIFLVPFSLLWAGFALFGRRACSDFSAKKRRTFYALTNQRVLILTTLRSRRLQALFLNQLPVVNKAVQGNGVETLEFGFSPSWSAAYANSGMELFAGRSASLAPAFYDLADVDGVYQLVMRLKTDLGQTA